MSREAAPNFPGGASELSRRRVQIFPEARPNFPGGASKFSRRRVQTFPKATVFPLTHVDTPRKANVKSVHTPPPQNGRQQALSVPLYIIRYTPQGESSSPHLRKSVFFAPTNRQRMQPPTHSDAPQPRPSAATHDEGRPAHLRNAPREKARAYGRRLSTSPKPCGARSQSSHPRRSEPWRKLRRDPATGSRYPASEWSAAPSR